MAGIRGHGLETVKTKQNKTNKQKPAKQTKHPRGSVFRSSGHFLSDFVHVIRRSEVGQHYVNKQTKQAYVDIYIHNYKRSP